MTEEIKEILDRLERIDHKEYSGGFEFADSGSFDEDCRCFEERKKLANYITNLQKENEKLKEIINDDMTVYLKGLEDGKDKMKEIFESVYKSRNEKAIEYNYKLQEKNCHQALFDEPLASEIYSIAENNINILKGGDE